MSTYLTTYYQVPTHPLNMCVENLYTYSCYPLCKTGRKYPAELIQCELFRDIKNHGIWNRCSTATTGNGKEMTYGDLKLKQRCPTCVQKAIAARVVERKEREERERDAERRGERGEVLRQLRMEEDEEEDEELTPRVSQQFTGYPALGHPPHDTKMNHGSEAVLMKEMEGEPKVEAKPEEVVKSVSIIADSDKIKDELPGLGDGSPKLLSESDGTFGLGLYF